MYGNDPLLNHDSFNILQLEKEHDALKQKYDALRNNYRQEERKLTPVWDEIDRITSSLSDKEFRYLQDNEEFKDSSMMIQNILQREYMKVMRPIVESTKDGKDALDKHLTLLKRLIKSVKDEADQREALMNEYITQYSNMTWQEFMNMKNNKKGRK